MWALVHAPAHRTDLLRDAWKSAGKVFVPAMALDVVYQLVALRKVYPGEVLLVAFTLAILPYLLVRSALVRLAPGRREG